jgi:hypothetical protein
VQSHAGHVPCCKIWCGPSDVVRAALSHIGDARALQCAPAVQANRQVILSVVARDGQALQFASANMRSDVEVVMVAIGQCGGALRYASEELRADPTVVRAAMAQNSTAIAYASVELYNEHRRKEILATESQRSYFDDY